MKQLATIMICGVFLCACAGSFKTAVRTWQNGPAYKGAVERVVKDSELDDTSRRLELMALSGLACTLDEDAGESTPEKPSQACACSLPTGGGDVQSKSCQSWAESM
jgi:hypothetical protein